MAHFNIALLKGDGIGPEIVDSAVAVLEKIGEKFGHEFLFTSYPLGGAAIDTLGTPLPEATLEGCLKSDSVILGAVGGPKWDDMSGDTRPEAALFGIRKAMELFTNLRPARLYPVLKEACPLRSDIAEKGIDIMIVRELTGGIYFGEKGYRDGRFGKEAFDTECYGEEEIRRIAKVAFELAMKRKKNIVSVDKANALESSRFWRRIVHEVANDFPEVSVTDMLVDNAALQLVRDPSQFDVIVTSNIFGDILSDEAAQITGSIGLLPSASLGATKRGLYEPIHGSAPDIAGKNAADPIATILSAAMMLRMSFGLEKEAESIENAVDRALEDGLRTADIVGTGGKKPLSCSEMTEAIIGRI